MSTAVSSLSGELASTRHRVLPGSVDLLRASADDSDASGESGSAASILHARLERQRVQAAVHTSALDAALVSLPAGVECNVWLYEQLRAALCDLNALLAALAPHCTAASCPVMVATADWEFLCAAHGSKPLKVHSASHTQTHTARGALIHSAAPHRAAARGRLKSR